MTWPETLRPVARSHQRVVYDLLFRVSAEAVQQLGREERWVGGQMGMMGVLHTWGRNLAYHSHVHYLVPGGGIGVDGMWRRSRANFLLPVKALSKVVRRSSATPCARPTPLCLPGCPKPSGSRTG